MPLAEKVSGVANISRPSSSSSPQSEANPLLTRPSREGPGAFPRPPREAGWARLWRAHGHFAIETRTREQQPKVNNLNTD